MSQLLFIPASNEPSAVLARAFSECREGQYLAALQRVAAFVYIEKVSLESVLLLTINT